ncbi:membrane protein [Mycoplasma yeatsii]|uniref:membrane protein n=1 Tax=Mycoplasma yeatsii TaxID=51365 RepID=UPI0005B24090|nr:membrane protein [Mycoplasma yeatsii]AJM71581.1 membrane protein [Mycoplasma yeatsii GM274B]
MKNKKSQELKQHRIKDNIAYNQEVDQKIKSVYDSRNYSSKVFEYNQKKALKWQGWLIVLAIFIVGCLLSVLVGYLTLNIENKTFNNWKGTTWFSIIYGSILFLISIVIGYIRNKHAMWFFNDRRRRYQKTLQDEEAKLIRLRKIFLISSILIFIFSLILYIIFKI